MEVLGHRRCGIGRVLLQNAFGLELRDGASIDHIGADTPRFRFVDHAPDDLIGVRPCVVDLDAVFFLKCLSCGFDELIDDVAGVPGHLSFRFGGFDQSRISRRRSLDRACRCQNNSRCCNGIPHRFAPVLYALGSSRLFRLPHVAKFVSRSALRLRRAR